MGYDKTSRLTKQVDRLTDDKHLALSPTRFNDLPKAGTFPHEEWTKIDDLKLNKPIKSSQGLLFPEARKPYAEAAGHELRGLCL